MLVREELGKSVGIVFLYTVCRYVSDLHHLLKAPSDRFNKELNCHRLERVAGTSLCRDRNSGKESKVGTEQRNLYVWYCGEVTSHVAE